jgi:alpha/beta superfamily hydrolase
VQVRKWLESQKYQPQLVLVEGADHFFHGRLNALRQALIDAF